MFGFGFLYLLSEVLLGVYCSFLLSYVFKLLLWIIGVRLDCTLLWVLGGFGLFECWDFRVVSLIVLYWWFSRVACGWVSRWAWVWGF